MLLSLTLALALAAAPTDAELETFGKAIAADLSAGRDGVSPRTDFDALVDRALRGIDTPADFREGFIKGLKQGSSQSWKALASGAAGKATITFKRVTTTAGLPSVSLRVLFDAGAFDFSEFLVEKHDGTLVIVDIFGLADGALRSETMRLLAIPAMKNLQLSALEKVMGRESKLAAHAGDLLQMNQALNQSDYATAIATWGALPLEVREHRLFMKPYITALSQSDAQSAEYEKAMGRYLQLYPEDAAAQVMGIDFYFLRKRWPQCLGSISAVEARAGKDAWFDVLRGSVALQKGDLKGAKKQMEAAIAQEPTLKTPYLNRIDIARNEKNWKDMTKVMNQAEQHVGLVFDVGAPGFEGYAASAEGKAYAKAHPGVKR